MNKKTIFLLLALVVVIATFFILKRNTSNTLTKDDHDFGYSNTESIDKIYISNKKTGKYVILKKIDSTHWIVNDSFNVNIHQINTLFDGFKHLQVKRPVSKKEIFDVKRNIAIYGSKVEIYEKGKLSKTYYVGTNTHDEMGSFFLMDKSEDPYVIEIPGFNGFISARYHYQVEAWRSKNIFSNKEEEIKSIEVIWHTENNASFSIDNSGKEPLIKSNGRIFENNSDINLNKLKSYLKLWENLSFEGFPIDLNAHKIDSISKTVPMLTLMLTDKNGKMTKLRIHNKGIKRDSNIQYDKSGNPLEFDIETFYAFINDNNKEVVQIQDYVFGKVMKKLSDFSL
ncbi:MAG: DUF4340 domain-containing protein [Bacteroidia bacterium]|nr:DUF4340 domain-containing protein [Bacteroidia bacterium]